MVSYKTMRWTKLLIDWVFLQFVLQFKNTQPLLNEEGAAQGQSLNEV